MSRKGNQRTSYTEFIKVDEHMVLMTSDKNKGGDNDTGDYHGFINPINCDDNQIMKCYLHTAEIPMTNYNINKFNDSFQIYLRDKSSLTSNNTNLPNGVFQVNLPHRNYTGTQLAAQIQTQLNSISNARLGVPDKVNILTAYNENPAVLQRSSNTLIGLQGLLGLSWWNSQTTLRRVANLTEGGLDLSTGKTARAFFTSMSPTLEANLTALFVANPLDNNSTKFIQNNIALSFTSPVDATITSQFTIGMETKHDGVAVHPLGVQQEQVWIESQPRFKVTLEANKKILIRRVDILGYLGDSAVNGHLNTNGSYGDFSISANQNNGPHLGLNAPTHTLNSTLDIKSALTTGSNSPYNWTVNSGNVVLERGGAIIRSHRQQIELGLVQGLVTLSAVANAAPHTVQKSIVNSAWFPNVANVNCQNAIIVRTNLRGHTQLNGNRCNIMTKIPVTCNQDDVCFYQPENPFRADLGQGFSVNRIDIRLTDRNNNVLDFNGVPNEVGLVFEVFDVVDLPIMRHNEHSIRDPNALTLSEAHRPTPHDFTTSGFEAIDRIENRQKRNNQRFGSTFQKPITFNSTSSAVSKQVKIRGDPQSGFSATF